MCHTYCDKEPQLIDCHLDRLFLKFNHKYMYEKVRMEYNKGLLPTSHNGIRIRDVKIRALHRRSNRCITLMSAGIIGKPHYDCRYYLTLAKISMSAWYLRIITFAVVTLCDYETN
jgi:hypothetical protein